MYKNVLLIIPSLLFSLLFYHKHLGLNFLLFSIVVVALLMITHLEKFKLKKVLFYSLAYVTASVFVFIYNSPLTITTSVIAFFVLLGSINETKASVYTELLNGLYSTIASSFSYYYNNMLTETEAVKKRNINYIYWLKIIGIPAIAVLIFVILYRSANPYFDDIIKSIDLSFINLQWVLFTILAYFLFLNISNATTIEPLTSLDLETGNTLNRNELKQQSKTALIQENQLGNVLLIVLNVLIIFFLITDIFYINNINGISASSLSKTVHQGIYALITSIVFAIVIILYFFRGNLNFYEKNKTLKTLTISWILLNVGLVIITTYKNYLYVNDFGFTYKRIGVFIYLSLALIGLITTYIKVYATYNLWYLFRKNIAVAFVILMFSCVVNWDKLITIYNVEYAQNTDVDYIINLSDNNTFLLKKYTEKFSNEISTRQEAEISAKYTTYMHNLNNNGWQELVFDNLNLKSK